MEKVALYSMTKPFEGNQIMNYMISKINKYLKKDSFSCVITDACAGSGSDSVNFSNYFKKVNSIEINKEMFFILSNNVLKYSKNNIFLYNNDYTKVYKKLEQDVIYLDAPWGGTDYKLKREVFLELSNIPLHIVVRDLLSNFSNVLIFTKVPLNVSLKDFNYIREQFMVYNKNKEPTFKILFIHK